MRDCATARLIFARMAHLRKIAAVNNAHLHKIASVDNAGPIRRLAERSQAAGVANSAIPFIQAEFFK